MAQHIGELSDRMREIFGLVVESYLDRGLPVGSKTLTGSVNLSPASIRGVMQDLEERGLLTHPHTSAGRIPTETGLRLFVDGIMQIAAPDPRERREIEPQSRLLWTGRRNVDARSERRRPSGRLEDERRAHVVRYY